MMSRRNSEGGVTQMVTLEPVQVGEYTLTAVEVKLPKTTLITVSTSKGYIMCGAHYISSNHNLSFLLIDS